VKVQEGSSPQPGFTKTNYKWSAKMTDRYAGGCPFGREEEVSDEENKNRNVLRPRSLADTSFSAVLEIKTIM